MRLPTKRSVRRPQSGKAARYNTAMEPAPRPSASLFRVLWNMRYIWKVWHIGREERREYGRLLELLLEVRAGFLGLGKRDSGAVEYRYPFVRDLWTKENAPIIEAVLLHLSDTLDTLRRLEWDESQIGKFPLLFLNLETFHKVTGEILLESLYEHESLLRGLRQKRALFDIERKLMIANKRATGINPQTQP